MANIDKELEAIKNAVYGEEVRSSIHDGIKAVNDSATNSALVCETKAAEASADAQTATEKASEILSTANTSQSYAVGGTGTREGEDTDNAKYYMEQAKAVSKVDIATTEKAGIVKPDGATINVGEDGTINVPDATTEKAGIVKPDGATINVGEDGTINVPDATTEKAGIVKLSDSAAVTVSTGLALPATEKNASIEGTMAHDIAELNSNLTGIGKTCCFRQSNTASVTNDYCPVNVQEYNDDTSLYKADGNGVLITKPGTYLVQGHFHVFLNQNDEVELRVVNSISELLLCNYKCKNQGNSAQFQISLNTIVKVASSERVLLRLNSSNGGSYIFDWALTNLNGIAITKIA